MKKYFVFIATAILLFAFFSCKETSSYDNYTWDGTNYTDADSDGIPDVAEADGTSFYDMPLYDWGARPGIPDLFVHVAPMVAGADPDYPTYPDGGMLLQKKALDRVVAAFAAQGIALHFDVGKSRLYEGYNEITDRGTSTYNLSGKDHSVSYNKSIALYNYSGTDSSFTFVNTLKPQYLPSDRYQIFYFMVFGSSQEADGGSGSSGIAYLGGRDFLITLANWGFGFGSSTVLSLTYDNFENYVVNKQASTIMHEFGHNLGLKHGGNENLNYKPNYYSIMNYLYQMSGLPRIGASEGDRYYYERYYESEGADPWKSLLDTQYSAAQIAYYGGSLYEVDLKDSAYSSTYKMDYSHGEGGQLDEASLVESDGLKQSGSTSVNWNGTGSDTETVQVNINPSYVNYDSGSAVVDIIDDDKFNDHNDWGNLYVYYNDHHAGVSRTLEDPNREIIREYDAPRNMIPFQRSK